MDFYPTFGKSYKLSDKGAAHMYIYKLEAFGPWTVDIGFFSTKKNALSAWKIWKKDHKNTEWSFSTKKIILIKIDEFLK